MYSDLLSSIVAEQKEGPGFDLQIGFSFPPQSKTRE